MYCGFFDSNCITTYLAVFESASMSEGVIDAASHSELSKLWSWFLQLCTDPLGGRPSRAMAIKCH
jgi:hypothetical protein